MVRFVAFAFSILLAGPAFAQSTTTNLEQRVAECVAERDDSKRLACFDAASRPSAPAIALAPSAVPTFVVLRDAQGRLDLSGQWVVIRTTDSMTDKPRITLSNTGEAQLGRTDRAPSINVRCFQGKLDVFVQAGTFIGSRDNMRTTVRFGDGQPQSQAWSASAQGTAVFAPNAAAFLTAAYRVPQILVEVLDFRGVPYRSVYKNEGLTEAVKEVASCWRPAPEPLPSRPAPARPAATGGR